MGLPISALVVNTPKEFVWPITALKQDSRRRKNENFILRMIGLKNLDIKSEIIKMLFKVFGIF